MGINQLSYIIPNFHMLSKEFQIEGQILGTISNSNVFCYLVKYSHSVAVVSKVIMKNNNGQG